MKDYLLYDNLSLLELLSKNDESAFTELYNRFWKKLFTIAYNRLKEVEAAEDIVHDVFAGIWSNRQTQQIDNPENYLAVAVKYAVLNRIKKTILEREKLAQMAALTPVMENQTETALHFKKVLERVHQEVEQLPARCRLIFLYSREAGLPVKEIAKRLHLSPKTVENQLGKAIRQLKVATKSLLHSLL